MKIIDIHGKDIKACAHFNHKGFSVSASTVMGKFTEIVVFRDETSSEAIGDFVTISDAISFIDSLVDPV